jgi:hypothetical protein
VRVQLKNQKDFFAGLLFMGTGGSFAWNASRYSVGDAAHMGPGYFALLVGSLLALLGGVLVFKALVLETEDGGRIAAWAWRPLLAVLLAILAFGLLMAGLPALGLPPLGLLAASGALSLIATRVDARLRWRERLILSLLLALGSYLVCILWLQLPMVVWPGVPVASQ